MSSPLERLRELRETMGPPDHSSPEAMVKDVENRKIQEEKLLAEIAKTGDLGRAFVETHNCLLALMFLDKTGGIPTDVSRDIQAVHRLLPMLPGKPDQPEYPVSGPNAISHLERVLVWLDSRMQPSTSGREMKLSDGPSPLNGRPRRFAWKGVAHDLEIEQKPFELLHFLWDRRDDQNEAEATIAEAAKAVWKDRRTPYNSTIKTAISKINTALLGCGIPLSVAKPRGEETITLSLPTG